MMMKRELIGLIAFFLILTGCVGVTRGNGNVLSEQRNVSGFAAIELATAVDLVVTQGEPFAVTLEAEENLLPLIETTVNNGRLSISTTPNTVFQTTQPATLFVTLPEIEALSVTGSGEARAANLRATAMDLAVSGSGSIRVQTLTADSVDASVTGSGSLELTGSTRTQTVAVTGSGAYLGERLSSETAVVEVTGSGEATVWANQTLDATVTASGAVFYAGNPELRSAISGSGRVDRLERR